MYSEDDLLPISALQHLVFCERRAALVHLEGIWGENRFTAEGHILHERADEPDTEVRDDVRIARGLRLRSLRLGLTGKADVVELHRVVGDDPGIQLKEIAGLWYPFPVEYKRGSLRKEEGYEVQLCAQALCLEEMLDVSIPAGAIYYGKTRRRLDISFDEGLRHETEIAAARLHELLSQDATPNAIRGPKCKSCSLADLCLPEATDGQQSARKYLMKGLSEATETKS